MVQCEVEGCPQAGNHNMVEHMARNHEGDWKCTVEGCVYVNSLPSQTASHISKVHCGKRYQCPICGAAVQSTSTLNRHMNDKHVKAVPQACTVPGCTSVSKNARALEMHMKRGEHGAWHKKPHAEGSERDMIGPAVAGTQVAVTIAIQRLMNDKLKKKAPVPLYVEAAAPKPAVPPSTETAVPDFTEEERQCAETLCEQIVCPAIIMGDKHGMVPLEGANDEQAADTQAFEAPASQSSNESEQECLFGPIDFYSEISTYEYGYE